MLLPILKSSLFQNTLIWVISRTLNHDGVVPQSSDVFQKKMTIILHLIREHKNLHYMDKVARLSQEIEDNASNFLHHSRDPTEL